MKQDNNLKNCFRKSFFEYFDLIDTDKSGLLEQDEVLGMITVNLV